MCKAYLTIEESEDTNGYSGSNDDVDDYDVDDDNEDDDDDDENEAYVCAFHRASELDHRR